MNGMSSCRARIRRNAMGERSDWPGVHAVNKHGMLGFRLAGSCQATLQIRVFWQSLEKRAWPCKLLVAFLCKLLVAFLCKLLVAFLCKPSVAIKNLASPCGSHVSQAPVWLPGCRLHGDIACTDVLHIHSASWLQIMYRCKHSTKRHSPHVPCHIIPKTHRLVASPSKFNILCTVLFFCF